MQSTFLKSHFIDLLFVIIFLLCLCIPNLHLSPAEKSEEENRMLAKYVPLFANRKINWNYGADFEKFYNDRFYCRRKLIELNNFFKYSFFTFQSQEYILDNYVIKCNNGWFFYRRDRSEFNYMNYDMFNENQLSQGLKYLTDIKSWCDSNGKIFVFIICPDKHKIYGEYFPANYKKIRPDTESRAFQFINYVRENSDISIIYPYEELLAEKANGRLLYYKNDTHWNYDGAYIAYKLLMNEICKNLKIPQIETSEFEKEKNPNGDLNSYFPRIKFAADEDTIYYKPKINSCFKYLKGGNIGEHIFHQTVCENKKYTSVFFRDSFTNALSLFISNTFADVSYNWRFNITQEDLIYIKDNADIVILECVERLLPNAVLNTFPKTNSSSVSEATK